MNDVDLMQHFIQFAYRAGFIRGSCDISDQNVKESIKEAEAFFQILQPIFTISLEAIAK